MVGVPKGLWNVVLSGYPRSGKTTLARRLVTDYPRFARISVDDLRAMLFNETFPCRDEFLIYSLIADLRDKLLSKGYSVVIDSTAPDNITRQFLLTSKIKHANRLLVIINVSRSILLERSLSEFNSTDIITAYDGRWEDPFSGVAVFEFKSNTPEEFDSSYKCLRSFLEGELIHKPELHPKLPALKDVRKALRDLLLKRH